MKARWQAPVVGFSLANVCLYHTWANLELHTSSLLYRYENASPFPETYLAMLINLVFWGVLLSAVAYFAMSAKKRWIRILSSGVLVTFFLLGLNSFRQVVRNMGHLNWLSVRSFLPPQSSLWVSVCLVLLCAVLGFFLLRNAQKALKVLYTFLTLAFPLVLFHAGWTVKNLSTDHYGSSVRAQPLSQPKNDRKIVWIIFDTMEERSAFDFRPPGLKLPRFDALRKQSVTGKKVYSPGARTHYSLASYLTGRVVRLGYPANGNDSILYFKNDEAPHLFSESINFFDKARELGYTSGTVGWYHPYCRMIAHSLDKCIYHSVNEPIAEQPVPDLWQSIRIQARKIFPRREVVPAVEGYRYLADAAVKMVADPSISVAFLHLSIPHPPWVFDRQTQKIENHEGDFRDLEGFWGNLELADITLGRIQTELESQGLWEKTTVLVTSDHWWWFGEPHNQVYRPDGRNDYRIPFMLKLAGHKKGMSYEEAFNSMLAHPLLLEVLEGKLKEPQEVVAWLDQHRTLFELDPVMETNIYGMNL